MNIDKFINSTIKSYDGYRKNCDIIAKEAQKYIDWDDRVSCEYLPSDGLCILATVPDDCNIGGMPECVCPASTFFSSVKSKETITPQEFKVISI